MTVLSEPVEDGVVSVSNVVHVLALCTDHWYSTLCSPEPPRSPELAFMVTDPWMTAPGDVRVEVGTVLSTRTPTTVAVSKPWPTLSVTWA